MSYKVFIIEFIIFLAVGFDVKQQEKIFSIMHQCISVLLTFQCPLLQNDLFVEYLTVFRNATCIEKLFVGRHAW